MKRLLLAAFLFAASTLPAFAQEYHDIDVDLPAYPEMQPIPESPVYYAPGVPSNYFYYDGLYWDYYNDRWYASSWYNGPWTYVDPVYVPTYVLWVPVAYYRRPPNYFAHWHHDRPPHWGEHWGHDWENRHNAVYGGVRGPAPARAPLPAYQRQYTRQNYPRAVQQQYALHQQNYPHLPTDRAVKEYFQGRGGAPAPAQQPQKPQPAEGRQERGR